MRRFASISATFLYLAAAQIARGGQEQKLPEGPGKETFARICGACHGANIVLGRGNTEDGWTQLVLNMIQRGAQGSEDEFAQIVQYLTKNFPPNSGDVATAASAPAAAKVNVNKATADELKSGLELSDRESQAVVSYRQQNGNYKVADDLKKVPDLDFKKIEAKKDRIAF